MVGECRILYTRDQLLRLRFAGTVSLDSETRKRIDHLVCQPYRGCRAGRGKPPRVVYSSCKLGQIPVITGNRLSRDRLRRQSSTCDTSPHVPNVIYVRMCRHTWPTVQGLVCGALNVHSANNKIDDILAVRRERDLDVMLLSETWHDGNSVSIRRLRAEGLQVLERARHRLCVTTR